MKGSERFLAAATLVAGMAGCDDSSSSDGYYGDELNPNVIEYGSNNNCLAIMGPSRPVPRNNFFAWSGQISMSDPNGLARTCFLDIGDDNLRRFVGDNFSKFYNGMPLQEVPPAPDTLSGDTCMVQFGYFRREEVGNEDYSVVCEVPGVIDQRHSEPGFVGPGYGALTCEVINFYDLNDCIRQFVASLPADEPLPPALEPFSGEDNPNDVCREDNPNREEECI